MVRLDSLAMLVAFLEPAEQRLDHTRVELRARALAQLLARDLGAGRAPVDAVARHRLVSVRNREDARLERNLVATQAKRIAAAVRALVVRADPGRHILHVGAVDDQRADLRMLLHLRPLVIRELPGLREDRVGHGDLADVVEEPRQAHALDGGAPSAGSAQERRGARERVWVHVAGAVERPGLYRVDAQARAGEAVDAAGGLTRRADLRAVNLASTIRDGQQIIVPARGEERPAAVPANPGDTGPGTASGSKLSLASATVEQLDGLDGIGPTLAQRIVEWRDAHGGFKSVDQLREVEGIGPKRFESLQSAVEP